MLRKFTVSVLFLSLLFSQVMVSTSQQTASSDNEAMELAAMLPDSDIAVTMDFNRTLNIAAPTILNQDAKKIEHLNDLLKTIENQIGLNPREIRQMVVGLKLPPNFEDKDFLSKMNPTIILKTQNTNGSLIDNWALKLDGIIEFSSQKEPSRRYLDTFKEFRGSEPKNITPESLNTATQKLQAALVQNQELQKTLSNLPKTQIDVALVSKLKKQNLEISTLINRFLAILKTDTNTQGYRELSVKLLNRFNQVTVDDPQKTAKLDAILKESKQIYGPYKKKHADALIIEKLLAMKEDFSSSNDGTTTTTVAITVAEDLAAQVKAADDKTVADLGQLPATRIKRNEVLNVSSNEFESLQNSLNTTIESINPTVDTNQDAAPDAGIIPPKKSETGPNNLVEMLKMMRSETTVNNKKMMVLDLAKVNDEAKTAEKVVDKPADKTSGPDFNFKVGVGFMDDHTMVLGLENNVSDILKRDAGYKNQKVVNMLGEYKNSLMSFAVNSAVYKSIANAEAKAKKTSSVSVMDSIAEKLIKDINFNGSINFDSANATNDITMSLGMYREVVTEIAAPDDKILPESNADDTFEFAGYLVGKDIFYDLFNSFKAVQASLTFKFEKKKVAGLVRKVPNILNSIAALKSASKKDVAKQNQSKPNRLKNVQDLLTTPQLYVDLAKLFVERS